MAKELPYFQFEPAEYLTGDISFCSLEAQGLFTLLCSYYWQRSCKLTKSQFLMRLNHEKELNELIKFNIISVENNDIKIKFLDLQLDNATSRSKLNSANGRKGGAKKGNQNAKKTTEKQPKNNQKTTEKQGIREDKIREDEIREDNILLEKETKEINNTITKKTEKVFSEEVLNCFDYCLNLFSDNLKPKNKNNWLDTIEKLNRIDKYSFEEIKYIVKSARNDDFWKMQFLSIQKLRKNNKDGVKYFTVFQERFNSNNNNSSNQNYNGNR